MAIAVVSAMALSVGLVATAPVASAAAPPAPYFNGFKNLGDAQTPSNGSLEPMFDVNRVPSGTSGITAASGDFFAQAPANTTGALSQFTRLGGYSDAFPTGGFTTSVAVYST